MRFHQSGTVYTQIDFEVSNKSYSNASATTVSRHTPLIWTEIKYCIRADMNINYLNFCLSSALAEQKRFFQIQGKIRILKSNYQGRNNIRLVFLNVPFRQKVFFYFFDESEHLFDSDRCKYIHGL